jgi:hypothetical protein
MDNKYNLNSLWRAFSQTANETLSFSVYNGTASIVMFKKGSESRRPVVKMNLSVPALLMMGDILKSLLDAQPGTRLPFVQMSFNKEGRTYEQATSFVFYKDDKRTYGIEISNKFIPTPVKVPLRCSATFSRGAEPLTDEQKSQYAVRELIKLCNEQLPEAMLLSRFNMEQPTGNSNGNGGYRNRNGGGNNGGQNRGGYQPKPEGSKDPYANPDNDDSVFG